MSAAPSPSWPRIVAKTAAVFVCLIGASTCLGWARDVMFLKSIAPTWPAMSAITALSFLLAGVSLWCAAIGQKAENPNEFHHGSGIRVQLARITAILVAVLGLLKLVEYLGAPDLGIDRILFVERGDSGEPAAMSLATAFNFLLLGTAIFLATGTRPAAASQTLALLGGLMGLVASSNYILGGDRMVPFKEMAFHSSAGFLILSTGILCLRSDYGLIALLSRRTVGGMMARRLVPAALVLPVLMGMLCIKGEQLDWFGVESGLAIFEVATVLVFGGLIWANALTLDRLDNERQAADIAFRESQRRAEERLRNERSLLRTLIDALPDITFTKDTSGRFVLCNRAHQESLGAESEAEIAGKTVFDLFPASLAEAYHEDDLRVMRKGETLHNREEPARDASGQNRWHLTIKTPLRGTDGAIVGLVGISRDITERRRAAEILARERNLLRLLVDNLPASIYVKDLEGRFLLYNAESLRVAGLDDESQAIHKTVYDFFPREIARRYDEDDRWVLASGEPLVDREEPIRDHAGRERCLLTTKLPLRDLRGNLIGLLGISRDVTERKQAEHWIQTQLAHLELLNQITRAIAQRQDLQSIFQVVINRLEDELHIDFACVCRFDPTAQTLTVATLGVASEKVAAALEMDPQAAIGIRENGLSRCLHGVLVYEPEVSQVDSPWPQRLAQGGLQALVLAPLMIEGSFFGVLIAARRSAQGFTSSECEFLRQLSEHVSLAAHQTQLYYELKKAYDELQQTQQSAMQQERLRALGQMASGIAHDINNAIVPVRLYIESVLQNEPNLTTNAREQLETVARAVNDVAQTVARMSEFSRRRDLGSTLVAVDINPLVPQVLELTRARWSDIPQQRGFVIRVVTELEADLPAIRGVESEMRDALTNLIFNAVDAMPEGGTLTVRTRLDRARDASGTPTSRQLHLEVEDTGIGMDEDTRRRCLEPFFTTKGDRGTGLGLAMVYGIVQRHGAKIEINSAVGQGTTFRITFPVPVTTPLPSAKPVAPPSPMPTARVLVVDDDPLVIQALRHVLLAEGHQVVTASSGQEGIDSFRGAWKSGEPFAVVITDLGMPYVDGRQVASAIKETSPSTPVILLTGWGQRLVSEGDAPSHVDVVLSKPPSLRDLREAIGRFVTPH